jgi:hypothetical protein
LHPDIAHRNPDDVPVLAGDKEFVVIVYGFDRYPKPVSQIRDDRDDSFPSAPCDAVFIDFGLFPVSVLGAGGDRDVA